MSIFTPFWLPWSMKSPPFLAVTAVLTLLALLWPGQDPASRVATPFAALIIVAAPYLFFRTYLSWVAKRGHSWAYHYTMLIYYLGVIGALLSLPVMALEWPHLRAEGMPVVLIVLSAPAGLAGAIAATEIANANDWGLTIVGGGRDAR